MTTRLPIFALTQVAELLNKMKDTDSDLRTMALMDLNKELSRQPAAITTSTSLWNTGKAKEGFFIADEVTEHAIVEMALKLLVDTNSEVKNLAVTCVAGLSRKPRLTSLKNITNQLLEGISATDEEQRDISCLALKSVVSDMPTDGEPLVPFVESINKKVLSVLTHPDPNPQLASELLQILTDMYAKYPAWATRNNIQTPAIESLVQVLDSGRPSLRKRAIPAVSALVATDPSLFDKPVKGKIVEGLSKGGEGARIWVGVIASLAKGQSVGKVGGLVGEGKLIGMILDQAADPTQTEAVEGSLAALETLVLRCPAEMATAINPILNRALELVKYDPNFVEIDEDEDDVDMNGDDEDDDFDDGEYSDDEDDSWKIRRSAAKLLQSIFGTRLELLLDFYDNAAGVLISKFNEREESVRVEVLTAFEVLLNQTAIARTAELASGGRNKRKRSHDMDEDSAQDDSAALRLQACLPQFLSGTLKELSAKSAPTRQQAFVLLRQAADILQGGLETSADAICKAVTQSLKSVDTAATSSLATAALSFLSTFFATHHPRVYGSHVESLVNAMTRCMKDKLHRISAEAFGAASSLAHTARPKGTSSPLAVAFTGPMEKLLQATTDVLGDTTVDTDIRERALETLGDLLVHEGDILTQSYPTALPLIKSRLANEASASTAMHVIGRIAEAPTCGGQVFEDWLLQVLPDVMVALRRSKRSAGKNTEFVCLQHVLYRIASSLPVDTADALIIELKAFIETPSALQAVALILEHQPQCRHTVTEQVLPSIKSMLATPTNNPLLNDALAVFCGAYVRGDPQVATSLANELVANVKAGKALPDATAGGTSVSASTARCIGAVVGAAPQSSSQVLHIFEKSIKSSKAAEADIYLALLSIGEIGRVSDLSGSQAVFDKVLKYTSNESEEVRSAAAFAAGNMAVGAPDAFLPELVSKIEGADTEAERILFLHALKEVILHSSSAQLEALADHSWSPLFAQDSESADSNISEDSVRNVKAACIGKLTTTAPQKFLAELQNLLTSSVRDRALVAAAVRYTFIDTSSSFDELIAPIIIDFLSLVRDENVVVRRLSLASFNAAIQNKPHLIIDKLNVLQPMLYQETIVRPELQREVQMGPWKVIEDDGLENRKTALETMYTMLGTCFTKIDLPTFIERVLDALKDHNDVKPLALMLLLRLGQLAPTSIIPRLDDTVESFRTIMKDVEVKDDTVKQDLERKEEMQKAALRTAVPLYKMSNQGQAPEFHAFVVKQLSMEKWKEFKNYKV